MHKKNNLKTKTKTKHKESDKKQAENNIYQSTVHCKILIFTRLWTQYLHTI